MQRLLEKLTSLCLLLLTMGSVSVLFLGSELRERGLDDATTVTHPGFQFVEAMIYAGCALFIIVNYRRMLVAARAAWPFITLAFAAILSTAWSVDPAVTLRRGIVLLSTTIFGIYLGGRYSRERCEKLLIQSFVVMCIASLALLPILPDYVLDTSHTGAFRGLTQHKNLLGDYMGIFLLLLVTHDFRGRRRFLRVAMIALALGMLVAARSGTSIICTVFTLLMVPLLGLLRLPKRQLPSLALVGAAILGTAFSLWSQVSDSVLDVLGKDRTLTGRSVIWGLVLEAIGRRPLLGYGFDAFWQGLKGDSLLIVSEAGWDVPHSHNGYLEVLLGLGVIGMTLVGVCLLRSSKDAIANIRMEPGLPGVWPAAFLLYYLVHATTEASLLNRDGLSYLLLVTISTSLALQRREHRARVPLVKAEAVFVQPRPNRTALAHSAPTMP